MIKERYTCIVCGRKFPKGQGIVIEYGNNTLTFHSSKCASKFFKMLLERVPPDMLGKYVDRLAVELKEKIEVERKIKAKKI